MVTGLIVYSPVVEGGWELTPTNTEVKLINCDKLWRILTRGEMSELLLKDSYKLLTFKSSLPPLKC